MTNPINRALTAFDEFIAAWLGPAAQRFVFTSGNTHAERVREAIAAPLGLDNRDGDQMFEGLIDVTELAQAAIDAMVRHMGPGF
ncbi:hypothetical protein [Mycolicibacterium sp.]|uniref:hypothetical protein n=1 Tax=Mycolicibacterium sp. TaxID=2320850 RepID=UPI0037CBA857